MPSLGIDLGSLELMCKESGLRARVSNAAKFAASEEDDIDRIRKRLTHYQSDTYSDDMPWITRGNDFQLALRLWLDHALGEREQHTLVDILPEKLRGAMLWQQLNLEPTSVRVSTCSNDCYDISVSLDYAQSPTLRTRRSPHKLGVGVPFQDVRPSSQTFTATLDQVNLDIRIDKCDQRRRQKKLKRSVSEPQHLEYLVSDPIFDDDHILLDDPAADDDDILLDDPAFNDDHILLNDPAADDRILDHELGVHSSDCLDLQELTSVRSLNDYDEGFDLSDSNVFTSSQRSAPASLSLKRNLSRFEPEPSDPATSVESVLDLVDAAIRTSIVKSAQRGTKGISVNATESLQYLASFAPTLWSPEYLPNIARRAAFLPTLSHALFSIDLNSTKSSRLRSRMRDLTNAIPPEGSPEIKTPGYVPPSSNALLSNQIWRMLARGTFEPQAARRLASLSMLATGATAQSIDQEDILDLCHEYWPKPAVDEKEFEDHLAFEGHDSDDDLLLEDELFGGCRMFRSPSDIDFTNGHLKMEELGQGCTGECGEHDLAIRRHARLTDELRARFTATPDTADDDAMLIADDVFSMSESPVRD